MNIKFKDIFKIVSYIIITLIMWTAWMISFIIIGETIEGIIIHYNEYQSMGHWCDICKW